MNQVGGYYYYGTRYGPVQKVVEKMQPSYGFCSRNGSRIVAAIATVPIAPAQSRKAPSQGAVSDHRSRPKEGGFLSLNRTHRGKAYENQVRSTNVVSIFPSAKAEWFSTFL